MINRTEIGPTEETFDANVIGVDVIGFSNFTQHLIDLKGAGAAEAVRDVLDTGFRAIANQLSTFGFVVIDSLGDGIILTRRRQAGADSRLAREQWVREAEEAFADSAGALRVRAAHASGRVSVCRVGGWQDRWDVVATGPGIEALHIAMAQRRQLESNAAATSPGFAEAPATLPTIVRTRAQGSQPATRDHGSVAEIRRLAVVFVALKPSDQFLTSPLASLQDLTILGQRLVDRT